MHHEQTCGTAPLVGEGKQGATGGGIPTIGQGISSMMSGNQCMVGVEGDTPKDDDGSFHIPGYRDMWVNPAGKHFVKINGI